ncbi:MAG: hypothetical protein KDB62_01560 [Solirubrobacterales bacterium]|nr:hypothetical protein [Solirubrobacterales bacterium]
MRSGNGLKVGDQPAGGIGAAALVLLALGALVALAMVALPSESRAAGNEVRISGKVYRFNHMDTPIPGAVIKVREYPGLRAVSDSVGDYELEVPDDANVTPYLVAGDIEPGGNPMSNHYNEIDLQTFHPRGDDIENANFQTPTDAEYIGLKAILGVPSDPADPLSRPDQCVVVTTSSARNVRGVDYQTFWDRTPHGVAGATAFAAPAVPGPIYFNEHVIPDRSETASSADGGIVWDVVPTGTFRMIGQHPTTRFASFLATCAPGRVVNANPPWGMYELSPGEQPLAASNVAAKPLDPKVKRQGRRARTVQARIETAERIGFDARLVRSGKKIAGKRLDQINPGTKRVRFKVGPKVRPGKTRLQVRLTDRSGVTVKTVHRLRLPKISPGG